MRGKTLLDKYVRHLCPFPYITLSWVWSYDLLLFLCLRLVEKERQYFKKNIDESDKDKKKKQKEKERKKKQHSAITVRGSRSLLRRHSNTVTTL